MSHLPIAYFLDLTVKYKIFLRYRLTFISRQIRRFINVSKLTRKTNVVILKDVPKNSLHTILLVRQICRQVTARWSSVMVTWESILEKSLLFVSRWYYSMKLEEMSINWCIVYISVGKQWNMFSKIGTPNQCSICQLFVIIAHHSVLVNIVESIVFDFFHRCSFR